MKEEKEKYHRKQLKTNLDTLDRLMKEAKAKSQKTEQQAFYEFDPWFVPPGAPDIDAYGYIKYTMNTYGSQALNMLYPGMNYNGNGLYQQGNRTSLLNSNTGMPFNSENPSMNFGNEEDEEAKKERERMERQAKYSHKTTRERKGETGTRGDESPRVRRIS